jgi:hypothetical protein
MVEALALSATIAAVIVLAAIAAVTYQRENQRRFRILRGLEGETVLLGIVTAGQARWICYVWARIIAVPAPQDRDRMRIDVLGVDERPYMIPVRRFVESWSNDGVFIHDILSIETPVGTVHHL